MVVSFVLMDFVLESRWAVVLGGALLSFLFVFASKSGKNKDSLKQGAYGKVKVHKEGLVWQLCRPFEVIAMLRCKYGGMVNSPKYSLSYGLEDLGFEEDDVSYCSLKLKQVSRSFATVITFLPNRPEAPLRMAVAIFYLVLRALDTLEDDMDLSRFNDYVTNADKTSVEDARLAAKQRLLREFASRLEDSIHGKNTKKYQNLAGFGEGDEKDLLENLDVIIRVMSKLSPRVQKVILSITEEMGTGMAEYIGRDLKNGTTDEIDFEHYCHVAAGTVGDGLTRLFAVCGFCPSELVSRRDLWDSMGSFLQRTNIIRDYLEDLVDGRAWWPKSVWENYIDKNGPQSLGILAQPQSIKNGSSLSCLDHMIADALTLVPSCLEYLDMLNEPNVASFCALPQVMALATLAQCYSNPKVFQGVVKVRKGQAASIMVDLAPINHNGSTTSIRKTYLKWFKKFTKTIHNRSLSVQNPQASKIQDMCVKIQALLDSKQRQVDYAIKKRVD